MQALYRNRICMVMVVDMPRTACVGQTGTQAMQRGASEAHGSHETRPELGLPLQGIWEQRTSCALAMHTPLICV